MRRSFFIQGAISVAFISAQIRKHQLKTAIGASQIFLQQVKAVQTDKGRVSGIDYTAYEEMALEKVEQIKHRLFEKYPIKCLHVYHSLGLVKAGGCCLFIFVSAVNSEAAFMACQELLQMLKQQLPIWGQDVFDKVGFQWKLKRVNEMDPNTI